MSAAMPLGALLRREIVAQLRRVRSFVTILIVMLIVLWIVAAAWPTGGTLVWAQLPAISTGLLTGLSFYLLVGAGLFIPGIAGTAIVVEREQQSWDLLALTQIRPGAIVLGKALSAAGMFLMMVVALFPVIGSLYFLVGVDWAQTVISLSLVLLTAVTCSFLGVACSAWIRRTTQAISASYVAMLFVMGLPTYLLIGFLTFLSYTLFGGTPQLPMRILTLSSPFTVLTMSSFGGWPSFGTVWVAFMGHVAYQLVLIAIAFFIALAGVKRRKFRAEPAGGGSSAEASGLPKQRVPLRQRLRERRWRRRKPRPPIPDGRNPMAVREIWWGAIGSARTLRMVGFLLFGISITLSLIAWTGNMREIEVLLPAAIVIHGVLISVLCASSSAGVFTKERELHGMDMLRITLLTPAEVVRGKYFAAVRMAVIVSLLSPVMNAWLYYMASQEDSPMVLYFAAQVSLLVCAVLVSSLAIAVSVISKRTSTAVVGAFIAGVAAYFAGPFLLAVLSETFGFGRGSLEFLYCFSSPVVGFVYSTSEYYFSQRGTRGIGPFVMAWGVNCLEFLVVSAGAYLFTRSYYARFCMRER